MGMGNFDEVEADCGKLVSGRDQGVKEGPHLFIEHRFDRLWAVQNYPMMPSNLDPEYLAILPCPLAEFQQGIRRKLDTNAHERIATRTWDLSQTSIRQKRR